MEPHLDENILFALNLISGLFFLIKSFQDFLRWFHRSFFRNYHLLGFFNLFRLCVSLNLSLSEALLNVYKPLALARSKLHLLGDGQHV